MRISDVSSDVCSADLQKWGEPSGVIRAFNVTTGRLAWAYDVGAPDRIGAPPPGYTYTASTPNSWAQMAYDEKPGRIYVPTGNAMPDHDGRQRRPIDEIGRGSGRGGVCQYE